MTDRNYSWRRYIALASWMACWESGSVGARRSWRRTCAGLSPHLPVTRCRWLPRYIARAAARDPLRAQVGASGPGP